MSTKRSRRRLDHLAPGLIAFHPKEPEAPRGLGERLLARRVLSLMFALS